MFADPSVFHSDSFAKYAVGQVARGDCSPRALTDPYLLALEHTAPHVKRSPRDAEKIE